MKRKIDAEALKERLREARIFNALEIVEELQGYPKFKVVLRARENSSQKRLGIKEHGTMICFARNVNEAKKKAKLFFQKEGLYLVYESGRPLYALEAIKIKNEME